MDWNLATAEELLAALRVGDVTSVELTDRAIERIERVDPAINAVCVRDFGGAREAARRADRARGRGGRSALLGIPVTVKESYNVAGLPTTWGMPEFRDFVPAEDALQVARLRAAGAVVLGKTNVPLGLQDLQSFNEIYGTTNNPWDPSRTPGGSSGGSAAALACGFGALSIGSDLAGSLRTPAHFCGVYAHKPTLGLVGNRGMVPPGEPALPVDFDLAVVGPMARSARDLALLLDVMAGPDPLTRGVALDLNLPPARHPELSGFRVLIVDEHPWIPTGAAVRSGIERVAGALADGGARVERHSPRLPDLDEAATLYQQLLQSGSVARFPVEHADRLPTVGLSHRDWLVADHRRELHRQGWRELFTAFDAVVCPVTPTPAFPHDRRPDLTARVLDVDGVGHPFFHQFVWAGLATMPGLPATAVPTGRSADGLPVGVQIVGPMYEDRTPLRLAELLEQRLGGFEAPDVAS